MTLWLQQHEAIWLWEAYLWWIHQTTTTEVSQDSETSNEDSDIDDKADKDVGINVQNDHAHINKQYHIARTLAFRNMTVKQLTSPDGFAAVNFIPSLITWLHQKPTYHLPSEPHRQI